MAEFNEEIDRRYPLLVYTPQKMLVSLKESMLARKPEEKIVEPIVQQIFNIGLLEAWEIVVPIDLNGLGRRFDDIPDMIQHMGVLGTADGLLRCREFFVQNMKIYIEETIPMMTAAEFWHGQTEDAAAYWESSEDEEEWSRSVKESPDVFSEISEYDADMEEDSDEDWSDDAA